MGKSSSRKLRRVTNYLLYSPDPQKTPSNVLFPHNYIKNHKLPKLCIYKLPIYRLGRPVC